MRNPEEKPRQFAVRKRRDEYDEPSVRRRTLRDDEEEPRRRRSFADEEEADGKARPGFLSRRASLREREEQEDEEESNSRSRFRRGRQPEEYEEDDYDEEEEEDEGRKAPKIVRIFAWIALLVILFALGYLGANYFFNMADRRGQRVGNVYGSSTDVTQAASSDAPQAPAASGTATYDVYVPDGGKLTKRSIDIQKGLVEDDITKVASVFIDSLKETNALANDVSVNSVFRNGDCLYLDVSPSFQSSVKKLGADAGKLVVTGLVRTMKENFDPITKIKFYVNGKESVMKTPVDLTVPCEAD